MRWLMITALVLFSGASVARDPHQVDLFRKTHACPATHEFVGPCPGWVVDHYRKPLCAGGVDRPSNMRWQEEKASYAKDVKERSYCACVKKKGAKSCGSWTKWNKLH